MIGDVLIHPDRSATVRGTRWSRLAVRGAVGMARYCMKGRGSTQACDCNACRIFVALQVRLLHVQVTEYGQHFETGHPVRFGYVRNTSGAPRPPATDPYQQRLEPAGRYLVHNPAPGDLPPGWELGEAEFQSPLVVALNARPSTERTYNEHSWKVALSRTYRDLTGRALSNAIVLDGYDAVVTVALTKDRQPMDTREIVDLTMWRG